MMKFNNVTKALNTKKRLLVLIVTIVFSVSLFSFLIGFSIQQNNSDSPLYFIMPSDGQISEYYNQYNPGIDIAKDSGDIVASESGKVVKVVFSDENTGNSVVIKHKYGFETTYKYMGAIAIDEGDYVNKGQKIGEMGISGKVAGPHIQFELRYNGKTIDPMMLIGN